MKSIMPQRRTEDNLAPPGTVLRVTEISVTSRFLRKRASVSFRAPRPGFEVATWGLETPAPCLGATEAARFTYMFG